MMAHPYKGIPRDQWPDPASQEAADLRAAAKAQSRAPESAFAAPLPDYLPPDVPRETSAPVNSETPPVAPIRNLFSGQMMKLSVIGRNGSADDPIPGWRLYWFHDVGNNGTRIAAARRSGYEHVMTDEIALYDNLVPGNNDLGSMVRTVMNPNAVPPTYGYLMKKPLALHEQHQAEMQVVNNRIEQAIRSGKLGANPQDRRYAPGEIAGSSLPKIEISSTINR